MGNFSSKDGHAPTGALGDSFHTPPASPQSEGPASLPGLPQLPHPTSPKPSPGAPLSSPPPVPVLSSGGKKAQPSTHPGTSSAAPDWRPHPPVGSNSFTFSPGVSPLHTKSASTVGKGQAALARNGGPPTSTPRPLASQRKTVSSSPTKSPSSPCGASPVVDSSSGQNWRERDSGLSQSLPPAQEAGDSQGEELEKLLVECRSTLGITASQDGATYTAEILKHLLTEVNSLKSTLQTERGEWLQFQADLQVAVSVADRLRAEAEEELTALRAAHRDVERELAASQQRQKEADMQLVTLRGELKQSRQRLAALAQAPCQEPERPNGEATNSPESKEGTQRGRERGLYRPGREGMESGSQNESTKNVVSDDARADCKGVTKRYLRNVTNKDRTGEEARSSEPRRTLTTERSRSLSRLPASSGSPTVQNGTSQPHNASTVGPTNKNLGQLKGRRSLDWQDSRSGADTGKREESLNKYNSTLTELPPTSPRMVSTCCCVAMAARRETPCSVGVRAEHKATRISTSPTSAAAGPTVWPSVPCTTPTSPHTSLTPRSRQRTRGRISAWHSKQERLLGLHKP